MESSGISSSLSARADDGGDRRNASYSRVFSIFLKSKTPLSYGRCRHYSGLFDQSRFSRRESGDIERRPDRGDEIVVVVLFKSSSASQLSISGDFASTELVPVRATQSSVYCRADSDIDTFDGMICSEFDSLLRYFCAMSFVSAELKSMAEYM